MPFLRNFVRIVSSLSLSTHIKGLNITDGDVRVAGISDKLLFGNSRKALQKLARFYICCSVNSAERNNCNVTVCCKIKERIGIPAIFNFVKVKVALR